MGNNIFIYIIRHGRTEWNKQRKIQGSLDSPLLPESKKNLISIGQLLKSCNLDSIYSSPLKRCRESAEIVSKVIGIPVVYIEHLMEINHGKCEGLTRQEAETLYPIFFRTRETGNKWNIKWPEGESYADAASRIKNVLKALDMQKTNLIIGHETTNKIMTGLLLGLSQDRIMMSKQKNNEIIRIDLTTKELRRIAID